MKTNIEQIIFNKGDTAEIYDSAKNTSVHLGEVVSVNSKHLWFRFEIGERRYQDLKFLRLETGWTCDHKNHYSLRHVEEV